MFFGTLVRISSISWLRIWIGLEINLLSFIPLINNKKNIFLSESSIKYFLIQAIASALFLFLIIIFFFIIRRELNKNYLIIINILFSSLIILKIGAAPFHFWFPRISEGINWFNNLILITWQKIAPIIILSYTINFNFLIFIVFCSTIVGGLGGLNQTSLRKLIAFSSINHIGWIIRRIILNENLWLIYFIFYLILLINIFILINMFNIYYINQTFLIIFSNKYLKIIFFLLLLSLGGLPPFLGFFPKWIIMELLISNNIYILIFFIILFSLITLFFYIRITYTAFILNNKKINWTLKNNSTSINYKILIIFSIFINFSLLLINLIFIY